MYLYHKKNFSPILSFRNFTVVIIYIYYIATCYKLIAGLIKKFLVYARKYVKLENVHIQLM